VGLVALLLGLGFAGAAVFPRLGVGNPRHSRAHAKNSLNIRQLHCQDPKELAQHLVAQSDRDRLEELAQQIVWLAQILWTKTCGRLEPPRSTPSILLGIGKSSVRFAAGTRRRLWVSSRIASGRLPDPRCLLSPQLGATYGSRGRRSSPQRLTTAAPPAPAEGADSVVRCSKRRWVVEVTAAFGLPLPALGAVAVAALAGAFDLGRGELEGGPDLVGLDLGD
jgi:hypothetical protein